MLETNERDFQRFVDRCFIDTNGILRWGGAIDKDGYGTFSLNGQKQQAHRVAYHLWGDEPLTPNLWVLHSIHGKENRNIVDVRFLRLGTAADNAADRYNAGRAAGARSGEQHHNSRLSNAQVQEIYKRCWSGESDTKLGKEFGVASMTISSIRHGYSWSWLTGHTRTVQEGRCDQGRVACASSRNCRSSSKLDKTEG